MYTKARIAEHPIHPMLVAFPITLYVATVVSLFAFIGTIDYFWYRAATYANIAAVVMAVVAAVPGLIDLLNVPAHSRARATGLRHAAFNTLSLVMFAISAIVLANNWFARHMQEGYYVLDTAAPIVLGLIGLASTAIAGYLGWTLVQTHHVGVAPTRQHVHGSIDEVDDLDEILDGQPVHTTERMAPPPVPPNVTLRH
ncbi:MAG: Rieske (2Fe-2S) oxidoreductase [Myxococcales bacterium]|nr:Rieske (2Fe-2S) oxidoreductase [Myxococcales bacterium]